MVINFSNSTLTIDVIDVFFNNQVRDAKEVNGIVIVVLENASSGRVSEQPQNNVYAVDPGGKVIWNIQDILSDSIFYPGIRVDGDKLIAIDVIGVNHKIDVVKKIEVSKECIR